MALKVVIDKLEDVPEEFRQHYITEGNKFTLAIEGDHPKVKEFRENNIRLTQRVGELEPLLKKFEGIDPEAVNADRQKLSELEKAKPDAKIAELEAALVAERAGRAAAQDAANVSVLKSAITDAFLKAGGRPSAAAFMVTQATPLFTVENGTLASKSFSPNKPGERLTVDDFILTQMKDSDFAFKPSSGGGAPPNGGGFSGGGGNVIKDPTPRQLGKHAAAIKSGAMRIEYSS